MRAWSNRWHAYTLAVWVYYDARELGLHDTIVSTSNSDLHACAMAWVLHEIDFGLLTFLVLDYSHNFFPLVALIYIVRVTQGANLEYLGLMVSYKYQSMYDSNTWTWPKF